MKTIKQEFYENLNHEFNKHFPRVFKGEGVILKKPSDRLDEMINWCREQHAKTNHLYDGNPYSLHLRMVENVAYKFKYLYKDDYTLSFKDIILACNAHDLIEDARLTYNDVKDELGVDVAEVVYAVTNNKGKTRKERANKEYYEGIVKVHGATFVKLCDRIANVTYSKMIDSGMFYKYKEENYEFLSSLEINKEHYLLPMANYLISLFV